MRKLNEKATNLTLNPNGEENQDIFRKLPVYYTNIFPVKGSKSEYQSNSKNSFFFYHDEYFSLDSAKAWLETFIENITEDQNSGRKDISFSAFYLKQIRINKI